MNKLESVALLLLVMLLKADLRRATSCERNGTFTDCGGSLEDCLFMDSLDAEFSLSYHFGRMLASSGTITGATLSPGSLAPQASMAVRTSQATGNASPPPSRGL